MELAIQLLLVAICFASGWVWFRSRLERRQAVKNFDGLAIKDFNPTEITIGKLRTGWISATVDIVNTNSQLIGTAVYYVGRKIEVRVEVDTYYWEFVNGNRRQAKFYCQNEPNRILATYTSNGDLVADDEFIFTQSGRKAQIKGGFRTFGSSVYRIYRDSIDIGRLENLGALGNKGSSLALKNPFSDLERIAILALEIRRLRNLG